MASEQTPEIAYLDRVSRLIETVSEHVRTEQLSGFKMPEWSLPGEQRCGKVLRFLHRQYSSGDDVIPTKFRLAFALAFSLGLESAYPGFYCLILQRLRQLLQIDVLLPPSWRVIKALLLLTGIVLLLLLLASYSAVGAYWTLIELLINRRLSRRLRLLVLAIVTALVGTWFLAGSPLTVGASDLFDASLNQAADAIRQSTAYLAIAATFFYIPVISHGALWLIRATATSAIMVGSGVRWLSRFHKVESVEELGKFLLAPLSLCEGEPRTLLGLEKEDIDVLHDWAVYRREMAQRRLLPTTLLLAFLGLLANTTLAESAVDAVGDILERYFQPPMSFGWLVAYWQLALVLFVVLKPMVFVVKWLNEAFVMDYVAEACVLARHAKPFTQEEIGSDHQIEKPPGLLGWLGRWLGCGKD